MANLFGGPRAILSKCGTYRYFLRRDWDTRPALLWIMLNPSTADAETDDPTIRRCCSFARAWGYGGIEVVNLFALRSPNPADLRDSMEAGIDPVGPENDAMIERALVCREPIAAWGAHPIAADRAASVLAMAPGRFRCLGVTREGSPRHPLYVSGNQPLEGYQNGN